MLNEKFSEEIKEALFQLHPDKALGPDGFLASFFQRFWGILGDEVHEAIEELWNTGNLLREINTTFIALVPKKEDANSLDDFQPISLCNTLYQILSKAMPTRLKLILPSVISEE